MVEGKPISIGNVAYVLGMNPKKLHRWYQLVLSGFSQAQSRGEIGKHNFHVKEGGRDVEISVPILEEKNLGSQMAVDEKTIDGVCYTILSNRQSSKIALMAATLKAEYLVQLTKSFDIEKRMQVRSLSRDMATSYDWFGRQAFMNAYHVVDKFHVIKNIIEQLQSVRVRYRQQELGRRREARQKKESFKEVYFANGDTTLQLLARSRGLLFLLPSQWSTQQQQRAEILFDQYPEIKTTYQFVLKIRQWFTPPTGRITYEKIREVKQQRIRELINESIQTGIEEIENIAYLLEKNIAQILHYFIAKETNAKAEALNQNLQRFINVNYGARNTDFFLYRVKVHFT